MERLTIFEPAADKLLPDLTPQEEVVLLARTLWREGYDDRLAGHITYRQPDGTFLCNPWLLLWSEFRPDQVLRIDGDGNLLEGNWPVPLGIPLHLELHRRRNITVALHHHPRWGTIWADALRVPPVYDQTSSSGGGQLVLVDEYKGEVNDVEAAAAAAEAMGQSDMALLANHGVMVTGSSVRAVHNRAISLEMRCRNAWCVEAIGPGREMPEPAKSRRLARDGNGFEGLWEAMARQEIAADPSLLSSREAH